MSWPRCGGPILTSRPAPSGSPRQLSEQRGGGFAFGPPKSDAGQRMVAIPEVITPDLVA